MDCFGMFWGSSGLLQRTMPMHDSKLAKMQSANHSEIDEHVGTPNGKA